MLHSTVAFNVMLSLTRTDAGKVIELASYTNAANPGFFLYFPSRAQDLWFLLRIPGTAGLRRGPPL